MIRAHDPTEAVLLWAGAMGIVMICWAIAERIADRFRWRRWARRLREFDLAADRSKYATRHHAGRLPGGMPPPERELQQISARGHA